MTADLAVDGPAVRQVHQFLLRGLEGGNQRGLIGLELPIVRIFRQRPVLAQGIEQVRETRFCVEVLSL